MNFLSPFFLVGALAIAGPVLFHLIRRTTRERVLFGSILFLRPTQPRLTHRSRLEHLLLLALRALAIALLAVGFARPFFPAGEPAGSVASEARRLVVLVDVSASMRRAGLWDQARNRAAAVLQTAGPGDEASVLVFGRRATPLVTFEEWKAAPAGERVALALGKLAAQSPGWEDDHLGDALIAAAEALADSRAENKAPGPRQIYLVSDLKAGSRLDSLQSFDWPKNIELKLEPVKARHTTNAGLQLIADAQDSDRLAAPAVRVRVSNAADSTREQFRVGWARPSDGGYVGTPVDVYVPPGQSRVAAVPILPVQADMRQIVLRGDDEDFDNTVYVVPPDRRLGTVLYFGSEPAADTRAPLFFLERALPDNPHLSVKIVARPPGASASPEEMRAASLVFITEPLPPANAAALRSQMLAGKTVVFAPKAADAAATLADLLGIPGLGLAEVKPADYAMFGEIDFRHPLFMPFADPQYSDFTKIHVWSYRRLDTKAIPGARVLARFDSGDAALVDVPAGEGRLLALLTGWSPADSQLAVSSKFVPLIYSMLEFAGGPSDRVSQYSVGDSIPVNLPAGAGAAATVRFPNGGVVTLPAGTARFGGTSQPGLYSITAGRSEVPVAVNLAASESRTEPLAPDELERYGAPGSKAPQDVERAAQKMAILQEAEAESRQKLWRWLLGATLAVLLVESALAGWTARRKGDAPVQEEVLP